MNDAKKERAWLKIISLCIVLNNPVLFANEECKMAYMAN
jgi:hypothetical protein